MKEFLIRIRFGLIPAGSRREKIYQAFWILLSLWKRYGFKTMLTQVWQIVQQYARLRGWISHMNYNYQMWMDDHEPDTKQLAQQRKKALTQTNGPTISFVTPVYNPAPSVLRDTLNSVVAQTYPHWEFCLANASDDPQIATLLDEFAQCDNRILVVHLPENLGISDNTNHALELASGQFIALLDHDDLVSPDMLYEVAQTLKQSPDLDIVYFDEDKISENGKTRLAPWFKPQRWSPDLLLSTNYLMHSVIRRELVLQIGAFDPQMDGAQDWDLALRLTEHTQRIQHIPRIFYHWRQVQGSASRDANAKPWAFAAQERCIKAHLQRLGVRSDVQVSFPSLGTVRILWPHQNAKVSIIIPTKNNLKILQGCLQSIFQKTTYTNYEILLIDNQSDDPDVAQYYEQLKDNPRVQLLSYPHPYNYHKINNWAAQQATGDVLVFLNNDTEVIEPTWLEDLAGWAMRSEIGAVGTKLLRPNGKIQHAGMIVGLMGHASHIFEDCDEHKYTIYGSTDWYRNYMSVTGACMAMRRDVFEQLDGFDETYIVGYGDIDICLRAVELGYRVVYTPFAVMLHYEGGTRGLTLPPSDVLRASIKMFDLVQRDDGFFNPNLSYASRQPALASKHEEDRGERLVRIMQQFGLVGIGMGMSEWQTTLLTNTMQDVVAKIPKPQKHKKEISRILIITHELTRSGAPIMLWLLAKYFKEQGYSIQVFSPVDGPLKDDYENAQIPTKILPHLLEDSRAMIPYLSEADIMLCNTILTWRVVYAAKAFAFPCLWWVHETVFGVNLASENPQIAQAFDVATRVVFPSQATANGYLQFSHRENFHPLFYGFDVDINVSKSKQFIQKKQDELHMICVATIEKRKGQDVLLEAVAALPKNIASNVHCHLIGRTHIDASFYRKIAWRSFWMSNVHLVGELPNEQVLQYLQQADVFAIASRDEALPLVLIEAMAFGKPIISSKAGGIAEVIHFGENGFVVEIEDAPAFADCIENLYADQTLRDTLGRRAREDYLEGHTISSFGQQMLQLLEEIYVSFQ